MPIARAASPLSLDSDLLGAAFSCPGEHDSSEKISPSDFGPAFPTAYTPLNSSRGSAFRPLQASQSTSLATGSSITSNAAVITGGGGIVSRSKSGGDQSCLAVSSVTLGSPSPSPLSSTTASSSLSPASPLPLPVFISPLAPPPLQAVACSSSSVASQLHFQSSQSIKHPHVLLPPDSLKLGSSMASSDGLHPTDHGIFESTDNRGMKLSGDSLRESGLDGSADNGKDDLAQLLHGFGSRPEQVTTFHLVCGLVGPRLPRGWRDLNASTPAARSQMTRLVGSTVDDSNSSHSEISPLPMSSVSSYDMNDCGTVLQTAQPNVNSSCMTVAGLESRTALGSDLPLERSTFFRKHLKMSPGLDETDSRTQPPSSLSTLSSGPAMLPPVHLSPRLPFVARRLADHFEARYAVKLCNLLDDVASLGQSCTTPLTAVNTGKEPIIAYSKDRSEPSSNSHGNSASPPLPAVGSMCALDEVDAIVPPISSSYPPTQFAVVADANDLYSNSGALSGPVHLNSIYYRPMNRLQVSREHYLRVLCELFQDRVNWGRIIAMLAFLRALCEVTEQRHSSKSPLSSRSSLQESISSKSHLAIAFDPSTSLAPGIDYRPAAATENAPETRQKVSSPVITASDDVDGILCSTSEPSQLLPVDNKSDDLFPRALHYIAWTVEFVHSNDSLWSWVQSHGGWDGLIDFENDRGSHVDPAVATPGLRGLLFPSSGTGSSGAGGEDDLVSQLSSAITRVATVAVGTLGIVAAFRFLANRL